MNQHEIMERLSQQMGITVKFNEMGLCRLRFDKKFIVDFETADDETAMYIYCSLGPLPEQNQNARILQRMMQAHYLGRESGQCCFGLDGSNVMLFMRYEFAGAKDNDLYTLLEEFLDTADFWTKELQNNQ